MSLQIVLDLTLLIWIGSEAWILARDTGKTNASKDKHTRTMIVFLEAIGVTLSLWVKHAIILSITDNPTTITIIGLILIWLGIILRQWAVKTLGKYFRTHVQVQKDHKVIQSGPYRYIRHPSYTAAIMSVLGYSLTLNNILSLIILMCFVIIALYQRIIVEEKVLANELGKPYQEYQKKTKKLLPFII